MPGCRQSIPWKVAMLLERQADPACPEQHMFAETLRLYNWQHHIPHCSRPRNHRLPCQSQNLHALTVHQVTTKEPNRHLHQAVPASRRQQSEALSSP